LAVQKLNRMRTVIYVGLLAIADAINKDWQQGQYIAVYATILIAAIVMDIIDFVRGRNER
jgi:hypothetical protein